MITDEDQSTSHDPRHIRRIGVVQALYSYSYDPAFVNSFTEKDDEAQFVSIVENAHTLDAYITRYAPKYPLDQIAKTDLAILRLALYELVYEKKEPSKVIINEAVELAKEMGSDRSYAFVNAVLGAVVSEVTSESH